MLQNAERILASATTVILLACNHPHEILARAGTETIVEESPQVSGEQETGRSSLRLKEKLNVHPNDVMQLPVGEAYIIAHGKAQRLRVVPLALNSQTQVDNTTRWDASPLTPLATSQIPIVLSTTGPEDDSIAFSMDAKKPSNEEDEQDEDLLQ